MPYSPSSLGYPRPQVIEGYVEKWRPNTAQFIGMQMLPMKNWGFQTVEWDELAKITGRTAAMPQNGEPQDIPHRVLKSYTERPFHFGDSMRLHETDILNTRALGKLDQLAGRQLVMTMTDNLQVRLDSLIEWSTWKALSGSLAIDENGVKRTITYSANFAATPTAGTLWSDTTNADPIANLQAWVDNFRGKAGGNRVRCFYNRSVAKLLSQNAKVRDLLKYNAPVLQVGPDNVGNLIAPLIGGVMSLEVYDGGYDLSDTYTTFIPDNKIIMIADCPTGGTLPVLGNWVSTPSVRNGGMEPRPGRWVQVWDEWMEPVPSYRQATGIYGVPIIRYPQCVQVATVA